MHKFSVKYIDPPYIFTLDDVEFGEGKRGFYVCTSTTHPPNLRDGDLLYEKDTHRLFHVVDENGTLVVKPLVTLNYVTERRLITQDVYDNKQIQLGMYPNPTSVQLFVCGIKQRLDVDYQVIDDIVSWSGKQLQNELIIGDEIELVYLPIIG